jgi:epoxyqueuosine reductase
MILAKSDRDEFEANPSLFITEIIKEYVTGNPENRLPDYDDEPIFDEPLVGFADGDDAIFQEFKKEAVVGDFHLTPREALSVHLAKQGKKLKEKQPDHVSVISFIFPITYNSRLSTRCESIIGSLRWNTAHHIGKVFVEEGLQVVVSRLEEMGYQAVAPGCTDPPVIIWSSHGWVSDWSDKHVAYAAGLGTFSLNGGLITPRGKAVSCGSLITDLALPPTPRTYDNHMAYCLFYQNGSCKRCIKRCPSGALSEQGYDVSKCYNYNENTLFDIVKGSSRTGYPDDHIICGLCETKVPCEDRIPPQINTLNM